MDSNGELESRNNDTSPAIESQSEVKKFSPEAREALEQKGFTIYVLTGKSINIHKKEGKKFRSTWVLDENDPFNDLRSVVSEVAINTDQLFIPGSNDKTLAEQEELVDNQSRELGIDGVRTIIGEAPDYIDLAFSHFDSTGGHLFGEKESNNYTITKTPSVVGLMATVGHFDPRTGLTIRDWHPDFGDSRVYIASLLVPS